MRSALGVGGIGKNKDLLNKVNVYIFLLVGIFNMFTGIFTNKPLIGYTYNVVPFFLFAIFAFKYRNIKANAYLFALIGILVTILGVEDNATGAIFLIFSFYIFNKPISNLIIIGLTLIAVVCKFMFLEFTISQAVNMILAYVYIFAIYYILIHSKPTTQKIIYCQNLDPETVQIIQYLADGYIYKEIAPIVELTEAAIRKRITRARELMQTKSTTELVIKCHKLEYIRYKIDKTPL